MPGLDGVTVAVGSVRDGMAQLGANVVLGATDELDEADVDAELEIEPEIDDELDCSSDRDVDEPPETDSLDIANGETTKVDNDGVNEADTDSD